MDLPQEFTAEATMNHQDTWSVSASQTDFTVAVPKEFGGPGGASSPEDLLAASISACLCASFRVIADHNNFSYDELSLSTTLIVDRVDGVLATSQVVVEYAISGSQKDSARIMQLVEKNCIVHNSLKAPVKLVKRA